MPDISIYVLGTLFLMATPGHVEYLYACFTENEAQRGEITLLMSANEYKVEAGSDFVVILGPS